MKPTTVFMGSPEFGVPVLQALAAEYPIVGVVTQPDRPAGRGRELTPPPVKRVALELGLAVIQPRSLRVPEALDQINDWKPELIVVAAFGQILRQVVLDLPRFGCINVHASLLPRWRGAAPIHAAILHGDGESGVSIMRMDAGIDTGPVLSVRAVRIEKDDTTETLGRRLAQLGAQLLMETLPPYLDQSLQPTPQPETGVTYAPMLKKEDGLLDFSCQAADLERRVRAYDPWPGAYMEWAGGRLKVSRAHVAPGGEAMATGERAVIDGLPAVRAADGFLVLDEVQPAGKTWMPGKVFVLGARGWT